MREVVQVGGHQRQPLLQQHGRWHSEAQRGDHCQKRGSGRREHDALELQDAAVAPETVEQPGCREHPKAQYDDERQRFQGSPFQLPRESAHAEFKRQYERGRPEQRMEKRDCRTAQPSHVEEPEKARGLLPRLPRRTRPLGHCELPWAPRFTRPRWQTSKMDCETSSFGKVTCKCENARAGRTIGNGEYFSQWTNQSHRRSPVAGGSFWIAKTSVGDPLAVHALARSRSSIPFGAPKT